MYVCMYVYTMGCLHSNISQAGCEVLMRVTLLAGKVLWLPLAHESSWQKMWI